MCTCTKNLSDLIFLITNHPTYHLAPRIIKTEIGFLGSSYSDYSACAPFQPGCHFWEGPCLPSPDTTSFLIGEDSEKTLFWVRWWSKIELTRGLVSSSLGGGWNLGAGRPPPWWNRPPLRCHEPAAADGPRASREGGRCGTQRSAAGIWDVFGMDST